MNHEHQIDSTDWKPHMYYTHMYTIIFTRYETVVYAKSEYSYMYVDAHMHVQTSKDSKVEQYDNTSFLTVR